MGFNLGKFQVFSSSFFFFFLNEAIYNMVKIMEV